MYTNLYCCRILRKLEFSLESRKKKNIQKPNFIKIPPVGAELFHANRWTGGRTDGDVTKLIVAFRKFENANKKKKEIQFDRFKRTFLYPDKVDCYVK